MSTDQAPANRVVDSENYGWYLTGGDYWTTGHTNGLLAADPADPDARPAPVTFASYTELAAARGPVRPVLAVTDADVAELRTLFGQSGRKTITTLAAALEDVFHRLREQHCGGNWSKDTHGGWEYARRTMMAGRAGSWEADLLMSVVLFGNGMNLAKATKALHDSDVDGRRAAGPVKRADKAARDAMSTVIWRWCTGPDRFTELAATLAYIVSGHCDQITEAQLPDSRPASQLQSMPPSWKLAGWRAVADQWLQPDSLARDDFANCYRLFCSTSHYLDTSLF